MRAVLLLALLAAIAGCRRPSRPGDALRLGFFPNVTHAQALVGHTEGTFRAALAPTPLEVKQFNAGPAAMEALLAGAVDVTYVGSGPAVIAFVRSGGRVRVIAGSASGGALLVSRDATDAKGLDGKLVAAPSLGNTQDIALRRYLLRNGLVPADRGGTVRVTAVSNPEILNLFRRRELEAAWVPEPWAARLLAEGGRILVDERELWPGGRFPTTVLIATEEALTHRRPEVLALLRAHVALTERARADPPAFAAAANAAFSKLTGKTLPEPVLRDAMSRIELTVDPMAEALATTARHAHELGYLPRAEVAGVVDATLLDQISRERARSER